MRTCSKRKKGETLDTKPATAPEDNPVDVGTRCASCGAELKRGHVNGGECGQPLPSSPQVSGRRWWPLAGVVIAVLLIVCLAGAVTVAVLVSPQRAIVPAPTAVATQTAGFFPTSTPSVLSTLGLPRTESPDPYEPDDSIAQAGHISTDGTWQERSLHAAGDLDYASFQAQRGRAYTIETVGLGPEIDTIIYLYDGQGQELTYNDDGTEELLASRIVWIAPESGTYYVMVRDLAQDSAGWEATYSLVVKESASPAGADPLEPDDDFASATALETTGTRQSHTFHTSTDLDFVSFVAEKGKTYRIETGNLQAECDTVILLYDEGGTELAYDDDAGDDVLSSLLEWTAPSGGTYYVKIRDFRGHAGPEVGYQIWVQRQ